jgi:hypothetical protein
LKQILDEMFFVRPCPRSNTPGERWFLDNSILKQFRSKMQWVDVCEFGATVVFETIRSPLR